MISPESTHKKRKFLDASDLGELRWKLFKLLSCSRNGRIFNKKSNVKWKQLEYSIRHFPPYHQQEKHEKFLYYKCKHVQKDEEFSTYGIAMTQWLSLLLRFESLYFSGQAEMCNESCFPFFWFPVRSDKRDAGGGEGKVCVDGRMKMDTHSDKSTENPISCELDFYRNLPSNSFQELCHLRFRLWLHSCPFFPRESQDMPLRLWNRHVIHPCIWASDICRK